MIILFLLFYYSACDLYWDDYHIYDVYCDVILTCGSIYYVDGILCRWYNIVIVFSDVITCVLCMQFYDETFNCGML